MAVEIGTDSYTDVATADEILNNYFDTDNWDNATTGDKEIALKTATRNIDTKYYQGVKYENQQALKFPRNFVTYAVEDNAGEIPLNVIKATALEASAVLDVRQQETIADVANKGIKSRSVEGTSVSYSEKIILSERKKTGKINSNQAIELLKPWLRRTYNR